MRVLFASGIDGFCHRYNVVHWAEQLATRGIASTAWSASDPRLAQDLDAHDVLVLYRVADSAWVRHLLATAGALGRPTVFAVDDLIVDPDLGDPPLLRTRSAEERALWHEGVRRYRRTLDACDALLATSEPIAALGRAAGKPTHLQRCGLGAAELALGAAAAAAPRAATIRFGYFAGTPTHDADLAAIAPALADLLRARRDVELLLVGPVALPAELEALRARIIRRPRVPWPELPALVAGCTASLAPLASQEPFAAAKGAVKYLEAAAVGVPVIASPIDAFRDAVRDGVTGILAADGDGWCAALGALADDPARAARMGAAARADVEGRFSPAAQGPALARFFAESARARAGAGREPIAARSVVPADDRTLARTFPGEVARAAREPAARPDYAAEPGAAVSSPLADGRVVVQRFPSRHAGLTRVDVHTVTYGLALDHTLEARVRRDDGSDVTRHAVWAGVAPDRDWLAIPFAPETASAGRTYTLELRASGTGDRNALSFSTSDTAGEPHRHDGAATAETLALRTFAAWSADVASASSARVAASPA
jgi:glycosyltransferase involved in cell wall biosynthesis